MNKTQAGTLPKMTSKDHERCKWSRMVTKFTECPLLERNWHFSHLFFNIVICCETQILTRLLNSNQFTFLSNYFEISWRLQLLLNPLQVRWNSNKHTRISPAIRTPRYDCNNFPTSDQRWSWVTHTRASAFTCFNAKLFICYQAFADCSTNVHWTAKIGHCDQIDLLQLISIDKVRCLEIISKV